LSEALLMHGNRLEEKVLRMDHYRVVSYYAKYLQELGNCILHWMNTPRETQGTLPHIRGWHP